MDNQKTLSQQLCELCGLEKFVNFENPENFVKLMELDINQENNLTGFIILVLVTVNRVENIPCKRQTFLEVLLIFLQEEALKQEHRDSIKQSIANYNGWVWG